MSDTEPQPDDLPSCVEVTEVNDCLYYRLPICAEERHPKGKATTEPESLAPIFVLVVGFMGFESVLHWILGGWCLPVVTLIGLLFILLLWLKSIRRESGRHLILTPTRMGFHIRCGWLSWTR
jgi:hypothetical protein